MSLDSSTFEQFPAQQFDKEALEQKYNCVIDVERAEAVLGAALYEYQNNELGFFENKKQAEEEFIQFLIKQGEDKDFLLNVVFLLSIATFGSKSSVFFDELSKDPEIYKEYRWLFIPEEVVKRGLKKDKRIKINTVDRQEGQYSWLPIVSLYDEDNIVDDQPGIYCVEKDETFNANWKGYLLPRGYQKDSLPGWYQNCKVLVDSYGGNVKGFLDKWKGDAQLAHLKLIVKPDGTASSKEFARFGDKIAALFLQWVVRYQLYELENHNRFGLPVDLQLARITIQTGIITTRANLRRTDLALGIFKPLIMYLCDKNGWEPKQVSEALWVIGSEGCTKDLKATGPNPSCPIREHCKGTIGKMKGNYYQFPPNEELEKSKLFRKWEHKELF